MATMVSTLAMLEALVQGHCNFDLIFALYDRDVSWEHSKCNGLLVQALEQA